MQTLPSCTIRVIITLTTLITVAINSSLAQPGAGTAENRLVLPSGTFSIPFSWKGDSIGSSWEPHTAMLLPVKLKNCPHQFYMQFDLGAPSSLFYKTKLITIRSKYPGAIPATVATGKLSDFSFQAGNAAVLAKEIMVKQFADTVINWSDKESINIIGTIGADLIDGHVVVIDYPNLNLTFSQQMPTATKPDSLYDFIYNNRSVLLPAKIRGKQTILYFDTGSSMFELLTDKKTAESLATPNAEAVVNKMNSWNKVVTAYSLPTDESIEMAGTKIAIHYSTYIEGVSDSQIQQMMKMGMGGMTGNKIFLDHKLVIDTKNKKFGLY